MVTVIDVEIMSEEPEFTLRDVCERCGVATEIMIEYIEYGIAPYEGELSTDWRFNASTLSRLQKGIRLQRDLDINLPGLALVLDLLDEIEALKQTQQHLLVQQTIFRSE